MRPALAVLGLALAWQVGPAVGQAPSRPASPSTPDPAWLACLDAPKRPCILAEAVRSARSLTSSSSIGDALDAIVNAHVATRRFADALTVALMIGDRGVQKVTLTRLAAAQARAGQRPEALQVARGIADQEWRAIALGSVAVAYTKAGLARDAAAIFEQALGLARGLWDGQAGASALRAVVISLARAGRTADAIRIAGEIRSADWRSRARIDVGEAQAEAGATGDAAASFLAALADVRSLRGSVGQIYDLRDVGAAQARAGLVADAAATFAIGAAIARSFGDEGSRDTFLAVIAEEQARAGLAADAMAAVASMRMDWSRIRVLVALAEALAKAGRTGEAASTFALAIAGSDTGREAARPYLLAFIADSQRTSGFGAEAEATRALAERAALALPEQGRASALVAVALSHATADALAEAFRIARSIADASSRETALGAIVPVQLKAGLPDQALETALAIADPPFARLSPAAHRRRLCQGGPDRRRSANRAGYAADPLPARLRARHHCGGDA